MFKARRRLDGRAGLGYKQTNGTLVLGGLAALGVYTVGGAPLVVGLAVGIPLLYLCYYLMKPACATCGSKQGPVYRHRRVDGGPDLRYNSNPHVCACCGTLWQVARPAGEQARTPTRECTPESNSDADAAR
jgi:hypothetical protein